MNINYFFTIDFFRATDTPDNFFPVVIKYLKLYFLINLRLFPKLLKIVSKKRKSS